MIRSKMIAGLLLICLLALALPAQAGKLVIAVTTEVLVQEANLEIKLKVANRGDEEALDVRAELPTYPEARKSKLIPRLEPGRSVELKLITPRQAAQPGRYAVLARVNYHDLNGHPYSALSHGLYFLAEDQSSSLIVEAEEVSLSDRETVEIKLINTQPHDLPFNVLIAAPKELSAGPFNGPERIPARDKEWASFDIWNLAGRAGSRYPVMLVLTHQEGGRHTTKVVRLTINLTRQENFVRRYLAWWLVGLALVMIVLAYFQFRRKD